MALLAACLSAAALPARGGPEAFLGARVAMTVPASWVLIDGRSSDTAFSRTYRIPAAADSTEASATNLRISGRIVPASAAPALRDAQIHGRRMPGLSVAAEAEDGPFWKNYLWTARPGAQDHVCLERIGLREGLLVDILLCFPQRQASGDSAVNNRQISIDTTSVKVRRRSTVIVDKKGMMPLLRSYNAFCASVTLVKPDKPRTRFVLTTLPGPKPASAP